MSKIFGFRPQAATQQLIDKFEDEVLIRHNNRQFVGTVYVDMQDDRWAVAVAYNYSRKPGLHGHENPLEVPVFMSCPGKYLRADVPLGLSFGEATLKPNSLKTGMQLDRFALLQERSIVGRTT